MFRRANKINILDSVMTRARGWDFIRLLTDWGWFLRENRSFFLHTWGSEVEYSLFYAKTCGLVALTIYFVCRVNTPRMITTV